MWLEDVKSMFLFPASKYGCYKKYLSRSTKYSAQKLLKSFNDFLTNWCFIAFSVEDVELDSVYVTAASKHISQTNNKV